MLFYKHYLFVHNFERMLVKVLRMSPLSWVVCYEWIIELFTQQICHSQPKKIILFFKKMHLQTYLELFKSVY